MTKETTAALQAALAGEHAALWGYGEVGAASLAPRVPEIAQVQQKHRVRRDAVEAILVNGGAAPTPSAPSYSLPEPISSPTTALGVAASIEDGVAASWRFVLGQTSEPAIRELALAALIDAARQALHWRMAIDQPSTKAFPGL